MLSSLIGSLIWAGIGGGECGGGCCVGGAEQGSKVQYYFGDTALHLRVWNI